MTGAKGKFYFKKRCRKIRSGIYTITNKINNKQYVGIASNIDKRWSQHKRYLIKGYRNKNKNEYIGNKRGGCRHHQINLQNEFNSFYDKYKERVWVDVYEFSLDIEVSNNIYKEYNILKIEDSIISYLNQNKIGYGQLTSIGLYNKYGFIYDHKGERILKKLLSNKAKIINWYESGNVTYRCIAEKYNTNTSAVLRFFKYINYKTRDASASKLGFDLEDRKDEIIDLYKNEGQTASYIGDKFGVCCSAITGKLKKWNIKMRTTQERSGKPNLNDHKEEIIDMYFNNEISFRSIGNHFNVSKTTVMRYFKKWKITERNKK